MERSETDTALGLGSCVPSAKKRPQLGILGREGRHETAAAHDSGQGAFRNGHSLRFRVLRSWKGFCVGSAKKRPLLGLLRRERQETFPALGLGV